MHGSAKRFFGAFLLVTAALVFCCAQPPAAPDDDGGRGAEQDGGTPAPDASVVPDGGYSPQPFADTYRAHSWVKNDCSRELRLAGSEPAEPGRFPVAIFLVGTSGDHDYPGILNNVLPALSRQGFVAASLEYENATAFGAAQNCNLYRDNARCMVRNPDDYVDGARYSAVARLCGRPKADCSKGVVFTGHSQGGLTSVQAFSHVPRTPPAPEFPPRLAAVAPLGVGDKIYAAGILMADLSSCMDAASLPLDPARVLIVNGENDIGFGGPGANQQGGQVELEAITGLSCPAPSWDCRRWDGSGYIMVKGSQVTGGFAGHEYMSIPGGSFAEPNWISPSRDEPWTLWSVARWLRSQTTP